MRAKIVDHQVLSSNAVDESVKQRCFRVLRKFSPDHDILPKSFYLDKFISRDTIPSDSGRFADIKKARLDGRLVCIKVFRTQTGAGMGKIKRVCEHCSDSSMVTVAA